MNTDYRVLASSRRKRWFTSEEEVVATTTMSIVIAREQAKYIIHTLERINTFTRTYISARTLSLLFIRRERKSERETEKDDADLMTAM